MAASLDLGALKIAVNVDNAKADQQLGQTEALVGGFGNKIKSVLAGAGATVAAMATAAVAATTAVVKGLISMASETAEAGDEVDKMSQRLGLSRQAYQEWGYVLSQSGVDINNVQVGMKTLTNTIDDAQNGTQTAITKFSRLGISMEDLQDKSREDIFAMTITGLQSLQDDTEKAALANDLFGRSGQEMIPLLNATAESTDELRQKARDMGMVMSDDAVDAAVNYTDAVDTLNHTMAGFKSGIMSQMLPGMALIAEGLAGVVAGTDDTEKKIEQGAEQIADAFGDMAPQIIKVISNLTQAMVRTAPKIITSIIDGVVKTMPNLVKVMASAVPQVVKSLTKALPDLVNAGFEIVANLVIGFADALPELIPQMIETMVDLIVSTISNVPKLLEAGVQLVAGIVKGLVMAIPLLLSGVWQMITGVFETTTPMMEELQLQVEAVQQANEELRQSLEDTAAGYETSTAEIMAQADTADQLVDRLEELQGQTELTALEQSEMRGIVDQLNSLGMDLNLTIDEQSGKLSQSTDQIRKQIESWKSLALAQAHQKVMAEYADTYVDAQVNARKATDAANTATNRQLAIKREQTAIERKLQQEYGKSIDQAMFASDAVTDEGRAIGDLVTQYQDLQLEHDGLGRQLKDDLGPAMKEAEQVLADAEVAWNNNTAAVAGSADALDGAADARKNNSEVNAQANAEDLKAQEEYYQEMESKLQGYTDASQNMFGTIQVNSEWTMGNVRKNLLENTKTMTNWSDNLVKLSERGIVSQGLLHYLEEAGPESALLVQQLVNASDQELEEFDDIFGDAGQAGIDALEKNMGLEYTQPIGEGVVEGAAEGVENSPALENAGMQAIKDAKSKMASQMAISNFPSIGRDMMTGVVQGMTANSYRVEAAARDAVRKAVTAARNEGDGHSPFRRTAREIGKPFMQGIGVGVTDELKNTMATVKSSVNQLIVGGLGERPVTAAVAARTPATTTTARPAPVVNQTVNFTARAMTPYEEAARVRGLSRALAGGLR